MMLIYPSQHELDRSDSRVAKGLPTNSSHIILKDSSHTCYDSAIESNEEMLNEESSDDAPDPVSALPRTLRIWNYDDFCLEQLGEGFFGNVYKVTHKTTKDVLVLKELKSATDEEHKTMFIEEIKTMHRLCHPNVLKCEGMALHDGNLCLLTEYITGGSLDELLVEQSFLLSDWEARLAVALEIAHGMYYLHSQGVIHRDLASKNILIRRRDSGRLQAIIADLGLSHTVAEHGLSEEEYDLETVGSPYHMAPEVLNHKPYNMKADVFSYGIILCEIITMSPGADPDDVPRSRDFGLAVEDFSEMASDCPSSLLDLTVRCCQFNPRERPSFDNIVKALDIMLDSFVNSDDDLLSEDASGDYSLFLDDGLICTCNSYETNMLEAQNHGVNDVELGVEMFKDRFGSVRKRASRRMLKSKLHRCRNCGGRVWNNHYKYVEAKLPPNDRTVEPGKGTYNDPYVTPPRELQMMPMLRPEYSAGSLLDRSQDATEFHKLVDNTPGKLPKFFQNLLRTKRRKKGIKDVKRKWRKSFHEIFSSQQSHVESIHKSANGDSDCSERIASPSLFGDERAKSPTKDEHYDFIDQQEKLEKCQKYEKQEKQRKPSRFRRKSEQRQGPNKGNDVSTNCDHVSADTSFTSDAGTESSNGTRKDSCSTANGLESSGVILRQKDSNLRKQLAISVDSLEKLAISEDTEKVQQRNRRYSMPYRKSRHSRTQSVETPGSASQKKTSSSSSKILHFLRKRSFGSPRDKE